MLFNILWCTMWESEISRSTCSLTTEQPELVEEICLIKENCCFWEYEDNTSLLKLRKDLVELGCWNSSLHKKILKTRIHYFTYVCLYMPHADVKFLNHKGGIKRVCHPPSLLLNTLTICLDLCLKWSTANLSFSYTKRAWKQP